MTKITALIITLITGLLFLVGVIIIKKTNHNKEVSEFSVAIAFSVIIGLLAVDILPEIIESFSNMGKIKLITYMLGFSLIGIILLKILDIFIPAHTHHHHEGEKNVKEHESHMVHIGLITSIAIVIHNIIEGLAIYTMSLSSVKTGLIMMLGVGLHNIPMGMEISANLPTNKKTILMYTIVTLSTLFGGLIGLLFSNISDITIGIFLCITAGMLVYIAVFELLKEIKEHIKSKYTTIGLVVGLLLMVLTIML